MSEYWFFLSYARRNDVSYALPSEQDMTRKLVRRLYEELAAEIISRGDTGQARQVAEIGFFDQRGIEPGDTWDDRVAEALRTSRVMLCLLTRNYLTNSKVSGQEFEIFRERVKDYASANNLVRPPLIIPILWHREDKLPSPLPPALADLQYTYDKFSGVYREEGLEYIMRLDKYKDEYQEFLIKLADRVVEVAEKHKLSPLANAPNLKQAKNAFEIAPAPIAVAAATTNEIRSERTGPGFAHFVFVAGQSEELKTVRTKLDAYGDDGRLWKPFVPDVDRAIGLFTQRAATDVDLQHEVLPVTPNLMALLDDADDKNTIVILVVDPWTLSVQLYADQMRHYDKKNLVSCGVLVVRNEKDQENGYGALDAKVKATFKNSLTNQNLYIRDGVTSDADLAKELAAAIVEIRRRLDVRAKLFRPVEDAGYAAIPQAVAPTGTST